MMQRALERLSMRTMPSNERYNNGFQGIQLEQNQRNNHKITQHAQICCESDLTKE
jgi:hypothetical protein